MYTSTNNHTPRTWVGKTVGGATTEVLTHGLDTRDVVVTFIDESDIIIPPWIVERTSKDSITVFSGSQNLPHDITVYVQG